MVEALWLFIRYTAHSTPEAHGFCRIQVSFPIYKMFRDILYTPRIPRKKAGKRFPSYPRLNISLSPCLSERQARPASFLQAP